MKLHFHCPKCHESFMIISYWKWIWLAPFHFFEIRLTKCPHCKQRSWLHWFMIER